MLNLVKSKTAKQIYVAIVFFVVTPFLWFAFSQYTAEAGRVDGRKVSAREYMHNYDAFQRDMQYFKKIADAKKMLNPADLKDLAWQRILLLEEARKRQIQVTDSEVTDLIRSVDLFREGGIFSEALYQKALKKDLKMRRTKFEKEAREYLMVVKVSEKIISEIKADEASVRRQFEMRFAPRDLDYVVITPADAGPIQPVSDAELKKIYDNLAQSGKKILLSFDEVKGVLQNQINEQKQKSLLRQKALKITKALKTRPWESVMEAESVPILRVADFKPGVSLERLGARPELYEAVEKINRQGQIAGPIPVLNGFVFFRLSKMGKAAEADWIREKSSLSQQFVRTNRAEMTKTSYDNLKRRLVINKNTMSRLFPSS